MVSELIGCLTGCGRAARNRGLCETCKSRQNRAIAARTTTDAELVAQGLRLPRKPRRLGGGDVKKYRR
jgi:hypothetical protein